MSLIVGALRAVFGADTAAFEKGVDQVDRKLKSSQKAFQAFGKKVQGVGKNLSLYMSTPLLAIGAASFKTAMTMEELQSAFDVTFKGASKSMRDWARETGDTLGRSTKEIQESSVAFASLFNKSLDPAQANELTKQFSVLTQDLASFKDLSNEVAQQKLFSGLTGEAEPLKSVGVFINAAATEAKALELGLTKVNGKFTDQQKIIARAALIQEQLAEASGDVVRTQDSTTNQLKRASAAFEEMRVVIGTKLLPVLTPLIEKAASALEWFTNLSAGTQNTILVMGGLAAAIGPVLTVVGTMSTVLAPLGAALAVATGATTGLGAAMTVALGPIGLVIAAIGVLTLAYKTFSPALRDNKKARDELYDAIDNNHAAITQEKATTLEGAQAQLAAAKATREHLKAKLELQEATLKKQVDGFVKTQTNPAFGAASILFRKKMLKNIHATGQAVNAARGAIEANDKATIELEKNMRALGGTIDGVAGSTGNLTAEQIASRAAKEKADKAASKAAKDRRDDHKDLMIDSKEEIENNRILADALKISQREYDIVSEKISLVKDGFIGTDEAARAMAISLLDSRDALQSVEDNVKATADALEENKDKIKEVADELMEQTLRMAEAHSSTAESIEKEIENNELLTEAMRVSSHEYEVTAETIRILESGYLGGAAAAREMSEALVESRDKLEEVREQTAKTEEALDKAGKTGVSAFTDTADSFEGLLKSLESGDIEGILGSIGALIGQIFGGAEGGKTGGAIGSAIGGIAKLFGGFKANGGPVSSGKAYIVGERGPEIFTPSSGGSITPNDKLGSMGSSKFEIVPSPLFDVVVDGRAAAVAAPIAQVSTVQGVSTYNKSSKTRQRQRLA